jgi:L-alanine-DL-glutamate epimerase-like enolase superfamily enzyme
MTHHDANPAIPLSPEMNRRRFLRKGVAGATATFGATIAVGQPAVLPSVDTEELDSEANRPVLDTDGLISPVRIERMEMLVCAMDRSGRDREWLVRVRSTDGAEGMAVANGGRMSEAYPLFLLRVAPFFRGKDARDLERHLWDLYRHNSGYKYQGMVYWCCVAAAEFAILDLLGKITRRSIGQLIGGVRRCHMPIYHASGNRGNPAEEEAAHLKALVERTGVKAVKFKVGGRMSRNADSRPGRSETLIPLARETLGPGITLYTDANSSYDVPHAIRLGRLHEKHQYGFFEEPVPFDHLEETRQVTRALEVPTAWGECESSAWRFRWMIQHRAVAIIQPDLHYYGGFIRSLRVARMAHRAGLVVQPHMSGWGTGYIDLLHFHSAIPNPGPFQEYKGPGRIPIECDTSSLRPEDGSIRVPTGPGFGITMDPDWVRRARILDPDMGTPMV